MGRKKQQRENESNIFFVFLFRLIYHSYKNEKFPTNRLNDIFRLNTLSK